MSKDKTWAKAKFQHDFGNFSKVQKRIAQEENRRERRDWKKQMEEDLIQE